jgi:hypothetical protein
LTTVLSIFDGLMARPKDWQLAIGFWQLAMAAAGRRAADGKGWDC